MIRVVSNFVHTRVLCSYSGECGIVVHFFLKNIFLCPDLRQWSIDVWIMPMHVSILSPVANALLRRRQ